MSRYKVALTVQDNAPSFYGVFDTFNKSAGFNGTLISRHSTEADARKAAAYLGGADLSDANLRGADLSSASCAYLGGADLSGANLHVPTAPREE